MKNATFRQLRVFNEVARHLSFVRAAENLHLTPPAVTMQVKELEGHVGMPLFERNGKKVTLTTSGEYMLVYAKKILATVKDAEDAAARLLRAETGALTIGMVSTSKYFMLHLLGEFKKMHEGIQIKLAMGNREQLIKLLAQNEVDFAVMGRPPKDLQLRAEAFAAHPHVFIAAPEHRIAQKQERISIYDICHEEFIVREQGSGTRAAMEAFFAERHLPVNSTLHVTSNETLKQAVMANLGLGFVSLHTIGAELSMGRLKIIRVEDSPVVRAWNVVHTQAKYLSPIAEAFKSFILSNAQPYLIDQYGEHFEAVD
jgi:LysR family transcriptional regulator, low CO2-responsive transcriptional regulator